MRQKLNLITLGVADFQRALDFYERGLGWKKSSASQDDVAFFPMGGVVFALYPRPLLADDAQVPDTPTGFSGITLAFNAKDEAEVDRVLAEVKALGARILKPAQKVFWGGYSGYFADLDGHIWEVAHNPFFPQDDDDDLVLP